MTAKSEELSAMTEARITDVKLSDLDFDISASDWEEMNKLLDELGKNYENKYGKKGERDDLAVVVGRFQPPHLGHLFQILAALKISNHVAILLGSANPEINNPDPNDEVAVLRDINNPFPPSERQYLFEHFLRKIEKKQEEKLLDRVSFLPFNDVWNTRENKWYDPPVWKENLFIEVEKLGRGRIDVAVTNDPWVKGILEDQVRTVSVDFLDAATGQRRQATLVRERLRSSKPPVLAPSGRHRVIRS